VGRYQKRERAKMVGGYSANDLAAILGAVPGAAGGSTVVCVLQEFACARAQMNGQKVEGYLEVGLMVVGGMWLLIWQAFQA
jgi:hypothetical protein